MGSCSGATSAASTILNQPPNLCFYSVREEREGRGDGEKRREGEDDTRLQILAQQMLAVYTLVFLHAEWC